MRRISVYESGKNGSWVIKTSSRSSVCSLICTLNDKTNTYPSIEMELSYTPTSNTGCSPGGYGCGCVGWLVKREPVLPENNHWQLSPSVFSLGDKIKG